MQHADAVARLTCVHTAQQLALLGRRHWSLNNGHCPTARCPPCPASPPMPNVAPTAAHASRGGATARVWQQRRLLARRQAGRHASSRVGGAHTYTFTQQRLRRRAVVVVSGQMRLFPLATHMLNEYIGLDVSHARSDSVSLEYSLASVHQGPTQLKNN